MMSRYIILLDTTMCDHLQIDQIRKSIISFISFT